MGFWSKGRQYHLHPLDTLSIFPEAIISSIVHCQFTSYTYTDYILLCLVEFVHFKHASTNENVQTWVLDTDFTLQCPRHGLSDLILILVFVWHWIKVGLRRLPSFSHRQIKYVHCSLCECLFRGLQSSLVSKKTSCSHTEGHSSLLSKKLFLFLSLSLSHSKQWK